MNFCIFSKNIKNFIEREFYDLREYHFIKIQHFYFKKMKRNLVNITEDLFWCSGQGCRELSYLEPGIDPMSKV